MELCDVSNMALNRHERGAVINIQFHFFGDELLFCGVKKLNRFKVDSGVFTIIGLMITNYILIRAHMPNVCASFHCNQRTRNASCE